MHYLSTEFRDPPLKISPSVNTLVKIWIDFTQLLTMITMVPGTSQGMQNQKDK